MRTLGVVAWLVAVCLSGCIDSSPGTEEPTSEQEPEPEPSNSRQFGSNSAAEEDDTVVVQLGSAEGGLSIPGRYPFKLTVPESGATEVEWTIRILVGDDVITRVEGPGCVGRWTSIYTSYSETGGPCNDLGAGEYEFEVVLEVPVTDWSAWVDGRVSLGNSTL